MIQFDRSSVLRKQKQCHVLARIKHARNKGKVEQDRSGRWWEFQMDGAANKNERRPFALNLAILWAVLICIGNIWKPSSMTVYGFHMFKEWSICQWCQSWDIWWTHVTCLSMGASTPLLTSLIASDSPLASVTLSFLVFFVWYRCSNYTALRHEGDKIYVISIIYSLWWLLLFRPLISYNGNSNTCKYPWKATVLNFQPLLQKYALTWSVHYYV